MSRGGQSQNPVLYSLPPIRIKVERQEAEPGDQAACGETGRAQPTTRQAESPRQQRQVTVRDQSKPRGSGARLQIQTPAPQVLAVEALGEALNLPRFLICKKQMATALRPMPDVSVKWVKTYKSPRTVSGTE